jgi:dTDP-4-dehydrorhamnose reductase
MTILVVGGDSSIGRAVVAELESRGRQVAATSRRPGRHPSLDLAQPPATWEIPALSCALVAAGIGSLAACEADEPLARAVNVTAVAALTHRISFVLVLSTTQVFVGDRPHYHADTPVCPANAYGRIKAEAEAVVLAAGGAVLRLGKVLSPHLPLVQDFVATLKAGGTVEAFADMVLAPVTLGQVAAMAADILVCRLAGIHHLSGDRDITYAEMARLMAAEVGSGQVREISAAGRVPAHFVQAHATLAATSGRTAPSSVEAVRAVVEQTLSLPCE